MAESNPAGPEVVVVFSGGEPIAPAAVEGLPADAYVIAADSGLDQARAVGWRVDLAVGDFDSASAAARAEAEAGGTEVRTYPAAKDATDLELALLAALDRGPAEIVVVGGGGGRLDHLVAELLVLTSEAVAGVVVSARMGQARAHVVRAAPVTLTGTIGELVTLLAIAGAAHGVVTDGLLYPLRGETLHPGSTRGVSNELVSATATVSVRAGVVLAILPGKEPS